MATKYWIAGNPNGEVTNAQVEALKGLSTSDLAEVESVLSNIPQTAETAVPAATAANDDSDTTELIADVAAIRTTLNSILVKLKAAKITL